MNTQYKNIE